MTTIRQRKAVKFCEQQLDVKFKGSLESLADVHDFLSKHLNDAKRKYVEDQDVNEQFDRFKQKMIGEAKNMCRYK